MNTQMPEHERLDYWRNRALNAEKQHIEEMLRRTRYQDALVKLQDLIGRNSPVEKTLYTALELPAPCDTALQQIAGIDSIKPDEVFKHDPLTALRMVINEIAAKSEAMRAAKQ